MLTKPKVETVKDNNFIRETFMRLIPHKVCKTFIRNISNSLTGLLFNSDSKRNFGDHC